MDPITRLQPLLDALKPKARSASVDDPMIKSFLDYIDQCVAETKAHNKAQDQAALEARRLQAEYDKKLAFLQCKVQEAFQAMMSVRQDLPPGSHSPEEGQYNYWVSQLQGFKEQSHLGGLG